uniref:Uncharacterized protein n=1 Tax=Glossina palpalis gambiensis TaxID=67801 RepID=A0A1B0B029_9MUSC
SLVHNLTCRVRVYFGSSSNSGRIKYASYTDQLNDISTSIARPLKVLIITLIEIAELSCHMITINNWGKYALTGSW